MDDEENQYVRAMRRKLIDSQKTIERLRHRLQTIESRHHSDLALVRVYARGLIENLDHLLGDSSTTNRD